MIQLSYQPAFDPFHATFRTLRVLASLGTPKALPRDQARILDFYLLFPFKLADIRLMPEHRRFRSIAFAYEETRPYGDQPDATQLFARMKPMQIAALETLAERGLIDGQAWKSGTVSRTRTPLPKSLDTRVDEANKQQAGLMEVIGALALDYVLLGPNGLKARTGLLEHRYDAV